MTRLVLLAFVPFGRLTQAFASYRFDCSRTAQLKMHSTIENKATVHVPEGFLPTDFLKERTRVLTDPNLEVKKNSKGSVFYWMQRDVRTIDNWALLLAGHLATRQGQTLRVLYALPPPPAKKKEGEIPSLVNLPTYARHAEFLLGGLELVHKELEKMHIPLHVVKASCHDNVGETAVEEMIQYNASVVVSDFSPIRVFREWMEVQALPLLTDKEVPFYQVDTHNVVPVWAASDKREYAARTIRKKIHSVLDTYLQDIPSLKSPRDQNDVDLPSFDRNAYEKHMEVDKSVEPLKWAKPGSEEAMKRFDAFCKENLDSFGSLRNDPNEDACSNLSPWINFGHVSPQRLALKTDEMGREADGCDTYIEESVVRRELADNFVYFAPDTYDSIDAAYDWAKKSLKKHKKDKRNAVYSLEEFELAKTHEDVWNAAQLQLVQEGHMHGFMRMYWCKKVSAAMRQDICFPHY